MIDFFIEVPHNLGAVESSDFDMVIIEKSQWAPGIWAGAEGMVIELSGAEYTVNNVDLEDRKIFISPTPPTIKPGTIIYRGKQ